jgi:hypothetical protein
MLARVSNSIKKSFYVDDFLKSTVSRDETQIIIQQVPLVLSQGGFNLTTCVVNDKQLVDHVPESHRAKKAKSICPESSGKVLGVKLNILADVLAFDVHVDVDFLDFFS